MLTGWNRDLFRYAIHLWSDSTFATLDFLASITPPDEPYDAYLEIKRRIETGVPITRRPTMLLNVMGDESNSAYWTSLNVKQQIIAIATVSQKLLDGEILKPLGWSDATILFLYNWLIDSIGLEIKASEDEPRGSFGNYHFWREFILDHAASRLIDDRMLAALKGQYDFLSTIKKYYQSPRDIDDLTTWKKDIEFWSDPGPCDSDEQLESAVKYLYKLFKEYEW